VSETGLSSFQLRVLSAVVLAPFAVSAVYFGDIYFVLFLALVAVIMGVEWCRTSFATTPAIYISLTTLWVLIALYSAYEGYVQIAFLSLLLCSSVFFVMTWFRRGGTEWRGAFVGPLYVGIPVLSLLEIRGSNDMGLELTLSLFFVVWATDIGAYFSGKTIGGPKIAPSISPNKTWAGLFGGMAGAAATAVALDYYMLNLDVALWVVAVIGTLLAVLAQIGDFCESAWKRHFKIKDASNLIPGHGGVLDRLDGVLFVAPALYLIKSLMGI